MRYFPQVLSLSLLEGSIYFSNISIFLCIKAATTEVLLINPITLQSWLLNFWMILYVFGLEHRAPHFFKKEKIYRSGILIRLIKIQKYINLHQNIFLDATRSKTGGCESVPMTVTVKGEAERADGE